MPTGAELFVDAIEREGIRQIFTLVGDHLNDVLLCAGRLGLRIVDMRHEAAVVHAADAWARLHKRPSLALVTGGPGHTNAVTGVATAFSACSPVVTVSGSRPSLQAQRGAFQELDQVGLVRPVVKWAAEPAHASQIPFYVRRAFAEAMAGRPGPVHITIPVDVFAATADGPAFPGEVGEVARPAPSARDVEAALAVLRAAERPVIIAGAGVWWSDAGCELAAFAEHASIPVYTISLARGVYPDSAPMSMGYADVSLNRGAGNAFAEADVVLVVGKRVDFRLAMGSTKLFPASAKFVQVDIHPAEVGINRRIDVGLCADAKLTLASLREGWGTATPRDGWVDRVRGFQRDWQAWLSAAALDAASPIHPAALFSELRRALPADVLYSWDGGDFVHWGRAILPANQPAGWVRLGPLATIGAALPNGLALQMAHPDRPVAILTGDGALGFYIAELDSLVRHALPVVIIVGNDAGWGLERELQGRTHTVGCELRATRYDLVMQGFGGLGENITSLSEVGPAVQRAFAARRPYLLNVNVRGVRSPFTRWKIGEG